MLRIAPLFVISALLAVLVFVLPHQALAQTNKTTTLEATQVIAGDYFAANSNVNIEGTVGGDAYVAGGNVQVDGVIRGDLLTAGGILSIRGKVLGNIRAAGGQVIISGNVGKNVSVAGGNITLIGAKIGGNVTVAGGNLNVSSPINGSLNAAVGQLSLSNGAILGGDLTYLSNNPAQISTEASVSGTITHNTPPSKAVPSPLSVLRRGFILFSLASLVACLVVGILIIRLLPAYTESVTLRLTKSAGLSFLVGLVFVIVAPLVMIALFITLVGIPLSFIMGALLVVLFFFCRVFAALFVGKLILGWLDQNTSSYLALILGLLILGIITYIPLLGGAVTLILCLMALGAVLIEKRNLYLNLRLKKLI